MSLGAEGSPSLVDFVWMGTCWAMGGMTGIGLHHISFIVAGRTGVVGGEIEVDSSKGWSEVRHGDWR